MKNKNFRKLKYVSGNPQNAGFCTIYPTASGGLGGPQNPGLHCSASLRSSFSTYFFKIASYFWKCWKPWPHLGKHNCFYLTWANIRFNLTWANIRFNLTWADIRFYLTWADIRFYLTWANIRFYLTWANIMFYLTWANIRFNLTWANNVLPYLGKHNVLPHLGNHKVT